MTPASRPDTGHLLLPEQLPGYLHRRGWLPSTDVTVQPLGGGVSNAVFAVHGPDRTLVVKQALPQLRVADTWEAEPDRVLREAAALTALHHLTPDAVPRVMHTAPDDHLIVIEHAPAHWIDWKTRLLSGHIDPAIAAQLGTLLVTWHTGTRVGTDPQLADRSVFHQLRVDPYYRTVVARRPDLAGVLTEHLNRLLATQQCLVHGDFSPKNVLTDSDTGAAWVIDLEVAHRGDPAFDVAFLLTHLVLKTVHRPADADALNACAAAFWTAYRTDHPPALEHVTGHVGCLLLARVLGKSPAEYLTADQGHQILLLGEQLTRSPAGSVEELWHRARKAVAVR